MLSQEIVDRLEQSVLEVNVAESLQTTENVIDTNEEKISDQRVQFGRSI